MNIYSEGAIMYDFAQPNEEPGKCCKCEGTGTYRWGAVVNGRPSKSGPCHSCGGTGRQSGKDIRRNHAYNRHKLATIGV
jgi:DnaJ-class molecular chaperone